MLNDLGTVKRELKTFTVIIHHQRSNVSSSSFKIPNAKYLCVVDIPGHFDRNGFLMDTKAVNLKFYSSKNVTSSALKQSLTIRSYKNSYLNGK